MLPKFKDYTVTIRFASNPKTYLFVSNDTHRSYGKDFDIRIHPFKEERNKLVLVDTYGNFLIKSFTIQIILYFVLLILLENMGEYYDVS